MEAVRAGEGTIVVRKLCEDDLERVIALDAKGSGRRRTEYFELALRRSASETGLQVSLAAELDGSFAGFLLARAWYGEFGVLEPVAVLEGLGVHPALRHRGVARALLAQLRTNLGAIGLARLRTEVAWDERELLAFFHRAGFRPAPRLCLELEWSPCAPPDLELPSERAPARRPSLDR